MILLALEESSEQARVSGHYPRARRLRLEVPSLAGDDALAARIERIVGAWPSVVEARASAVSGRLLVRYEGAPPSELWDGAEAEKGAGRGRVRGGGAPWSRLSRLAARTREKLRRGTEEPAGDRREPRSWHAMEPGEVLSSLDTRPAGLSSSVAERRLAYIGPNLLDGPREPSRLALLRSQFTSTPALILTGSAGLALLLGDVADATAIGAVLILNGAIGYYVERRNQGVLASWRRLEAPTALVLRDGLQKTIPAADLVPGDVVLLHPGDLVPADCRLFEAEEMACDESTLTGESEPRPKSVEPAPKGAELGDRISMAFSGTTVASGSGTAVVTETGAETELAAIGRLIEEGEGTAPLTKRLERLSSRLVYTAAGAAGAVALAGLAHGRPLNRVLRGAVALGVASIPEGLPLVANAALVKSMQRLREEGIVVRRLAAAEALGSVSVVCADKTGTLTLNEMRVELLEVGGEEIDTSSVRADPGRLFEDPTSLALAALLLNSDVDIHRKNSDITVGGSSTEVALVRLARAAGLDPLELNARHPRLELKPRSEERHYVTSLHRCPDGELVAFVKGAAEQVLEICDRYVDRRLDASLRRTFLERGEELARRGLRVLAMGWRRAREEGSPPEGGFTLLGLVGLGDPVRGGAARTVRDLGRAGVRTIMVTGDHRHTAEAVARRIGLDGDVLTGEEIARLAEAGEPSELARLDRVAVVARVAPADKLAIVRALQRRGDVVAMFGDGVNDAPALDLAEVGVAVGSKATDLARRTADMVLAGEDLSAILSAVQEGRGVQDNLHRCIRYLLATNLSELSLMSGAALLGRPEPLSPTQLLWINLISDTLPALALALEPTRLLELERGTAAAASDPLPRSMRREIARDGLLMGAAGGAAAAGGPGITFSLLGGIQIGYASFARAAGAPKGPSSDRRFVALTGSAALLHLAALSIAPLRSLLALPAGGSPLSFAAGVCAPLLLRGMTAGERIHRFGPTRRRSIEAADAPREMNT